MFDLHIRGKQLLIIEELPLFFRCQTPQLLLSNSSVWGSRLPLVCPLAANRVSRLAVSKRPGPFAFSVCGRGWGGSFLRPLCLVRERDLCRGREPPWPSHCPSPSSQPTDFLLLQPPLTWAHLANLEKLESPGRFGRLSPSQLGADETANEMLYEPLRTMAAHPCVMPCKAGMVRLLHEYLDLHGATWLIIHSFPELCS